jgi:hypothetical protein
MLIQLNCFLIGQSDGLKPNCYYSINLDITVHHNIKRQ